MEPAKNISLSNRDAMAAIGGFADDHIESGFSRFVARERDLIDQETHNQQHYDSEKQQEAADDDIGHAFLFRSRASDAEGCDERFRDVGQQLHRSANRIPLSNLIGQ
jgi:hypothetical protein